MDSLVSGSVGKEVIFEGLETRYFDVREEAEGLQRQDHRRI